MTDEHDNEPQASVPPTPIPPEWTQPKPRHGQDIWLGVLFAFLINLFGVFIITAFPDIGPVIAILMGAGHIAAIIGVYKAQRPYIGRGMLIFHGIVIGLPLLALGACLVNAWLH